MRILSMGGNFQDAQNLVERVLYGPDRVATASNRQNFEQGFEYLSFRDPYRSSPIK